MTGSRALDHVRAMSAGLVQVMAGNAQDPEAERVFRADLEWACTHGHPLTIEPLNPHDVPGYRLNSYAQALWQVRDLPVAVPWQAGRRGGVVAEWARVTPRVGHLQIAGSAGRAEPGADVLVFVRQVVAGGYTGWVAAECRPTADTAAGLGRLAALRDG